MTRFTVNGQAVHYRLDPETPLLWALRDASNLTGTKYGCGTGHCGACTVLVDGRAVHSCAVAIGQLEGSMVTTIEGLSSDRSHPVQRAWIAASVPQCGFCIPGMIMAAAALIERSGPLSDEDIDAALANLCRCGVYPRVREAVRGALRFGGSEEPAGNATREPPRGAPSLVPPEPRR
jgi:isoquinoline 1-oxidoreductase alpha subunit